MQAPPGEEQIDVAEFIVRALVRQGVRHVFGYPGGSIVPILKRIEQHPELQFVLCRSEANAAFAASATAKCTGTLGVCLATAGPGASNLITGLLDAHSDRASVLAITGQLPTLNKGRGSEFQDLDQSFLFRSVTGCSATISHPEAVPSMLVDAVGKALNDRDVSHICMPWDLWDVVLPARLHKELARYPLVPIRSTAPGRFTQDLFKKVAKELVARAPGLAVVVGARAAGCGELVEELATVLQCPIISTLDAKGIVREDHPCSVGVLGIFGSPGFEVSKEVLEGIGCVVSVGVDNPAPFLAGADGSQIRDNVAIEPDFSCMGSHFRTSHLLIGPVAEALASLTACCKACGTAPVRQKTVLEDMQRGKAAFFKTLDDAAAAAESTVHTHPVRVLRVLGELLAARKPHSTVVVPDVGDNTVFTALFLPCVQREQIVFTNQQGVMGWGLPGAIACRLARPEALVVSVAGDGGVLMSVEELATAVQCKVSVVVVVFKNRQLKRIVDSPFISIADCDFAKLAEAFGAKGLRVQGSSEEPLRRTLQEALAHAEADLGPVVVEVDVDPAVNAPMALWRAEGHLSFK